MSRLTFLGGVFFVTGTILFSAFGLAAISVIALAYGFQWAGKLLFQAFLELHED